MVSIGDVVVNAFPAAKVVDGPGIEIPPEALVPVATFLREHDTHRFEILDAIGPPSIDAEHFDYELKTSLTPAGLKLLVRIGADRALPSVAEVYGAARRLEKRAHRRFGVAFAGHPDPAVREPRAPDSGVHEGALYWCDLKNGILGGGRVHALHRFGFGFESITATEPDGTAVTGVRRTVRPVFLGSPTHTHLVQTTPMWLVSRLHSEGLAPVGFELGPDSAALFTDAAKGRYVAREHVFSPEVAGGDLVRRWAQALVASLSARASLIAMSVDRRSFAAVDLVANRERVSFRRPELEPAFMQMTPGELLAYFDGAWISDSALREVVDECDTPTARLLRARFESETDQRASHLERGFALLADEGASSDVMGAYTSAAIFMLEADTPLFAEHRPSRPWALRAMLLEVDDALSECREAITRSARGPEALAKIDGAVDSAKAALEAGTAEEVESSISQVEAVFTLLRAVRERG